LSGGGQTELLCPLCGMEVRQCRKTLEAVMTIKVKHEENLSKENPPGF
jgi:hypothetical protein